MNKLGLIVSTGFVVADWCERPSYWKLKAFRSFNTDIEYLRKTYYPSVGRPSFPQRGEVRITIYRGISEIVIRDAACNCPLQFRLRC